eukprot:SAG11_NODE_5714_length_1481_cov_0.903039_3_plen_131_part_01
MVVNREGLGAITVLRRFGQHRALRAVQTLVEVWVDQRELQSTYVGRAVIFELSLPLRFDRIALRFFGIRPERPLPTAPLLLPTAPQCYPPPPKTLWAQSVFEQRPGPVRECVCKSAVSSERATHGAQGWPV